MYLRISQGSILILQISFNCDPPFEAFRLQVIEHDKRVPTQCKAITNLFLLLDFSRYYPYKVHHNKNRHFDIVNSESPIAESTTSSQTNRIQASHQTWHLWLDNLVFKGPVRYRWRGQTISSPIKRTHTHWRWISHHLGRTSLRPFPSISSRPSSVPSRTPPVREPTRTISMDSVT